VRGREKWGGVLDGKIEMGGLQMGLGYTKRMGIFGDFTRHGRPPRLHRKSGGGGWGVRVLKDASNHLYKRVTSFGKSC